MRVCALIISACFLLSGCQINRHAGTVPGTTHPSVSTAQPSAADRRHDIEITQSLRRAIIDDQSMSVNARNIMIATNAGVVTLRGAVDDEMERNKIIGKANQTPGIKGIQDQLETLNRSVATGSGTSR